MGNQQLNYTKQVFEVLSQNLSVRVLLLKSYGGQRVSLEEKETCVLAPAMVYPNVELS